MKKFTNSQRYSTHSPNESYKIPDPHQCLEKGLVGTPKHTLPSYVSSDSGSNLTKHLQSVGVHDSNAPKRSTLLKGLYKERLTWLKFDLSIFILGEFRGVFNLLSPSFLAHFPQDLGHLASNLCGATKHYRSITRFEDTRVLLYSNHGGEGLDGLKVSILLHINDVTRLDLLIFANTLDGETDRVPRACLLKLFLVLFNGENFFVLKTRRNDSNDITRHKSSL